MWINPKTREEVETALDKGQLFARVYPGVNRFWQARRNGKTVTWKRRPDDFRIPVKCGYMGRVSITPPALRDDVLRVAASREEAEAAHKS